jgi:3-hydroxyisobutyrate dehydrogenase-like beta-hydroxyacid dehydrogenase
MGKPMAMRLLNGGHSLTVFALDNAKMAYFVSLGAGAASSPKEVAAASDLIITIVSDTRDVELVLFGEDGVFYGLNRGSTVLDMSTISPLATVEFARRISSQGCNMFDAPVSGGEKGAIEGTLSIMVGGERSLFDKILPVLQMLGKTIIYVGSNGNGQKTKMVNQVVVALNVLAMVEGLRLAEAGGLDLQTTFAAVCGGAAASWILTNLGPKILANDFTPGFRIRLQQKDLRLATEWIQQLDLNLPGTQLTYSLFSNALEKGLGTESTHALIKLWDKRQPSS